MPIFDLPPNQKKEEYELRELMYRVLEAIGFGIQDPNTVPYSMQAKLEAMFNRMFGTSATDTKLDRLIQVLDFLTNDRQAKVLNHVKSGEFSSKLDWTVGTTPVTLFNYRSFRKAVSIFNSSDTAIVYIDFGNNNTFTVSPTIHSFYLPPKRLFFENLRFEGYIRVVSTEANTVVRATDFYGGSGVTTI